MENTIKQQTQTQLITPAQLLAHYQGHRGLTRRVIEAFPEKEFFSFKIGGMRTSAEMSMELLGIAVPGLNEIVTKGSTELNEHFDHGNQKSSILERWDADTEKIEELWNKIPLERYQEHIKLFGQYEGTVQSSILYFIDNEIHHSGQCYVYLRALGIEPPFFYDR